MAPSRVTESRSYDHVTTQEPLQHPGAAGGGRAWRGGGLLGRQAEVRQPGPGLGGAGAARHTAVQQRWVVTSGT